MFQNTNLKFMLDQDTDIKLKINCFFQEVAGIKASGGVQDKKER